MTHPSAALPRVVRPGLAYNLAGIAALVLLLAVACGYAIDQLSRREHVPLPGIGDGDPVVQTLAGHELSIPRSWFRYGEQLRDGFTAQIDLRLPLPAAATGEMLPVDVTLLPRSRTRASAILLDAVYVHQFGDETLDGVPGLVGKPLGGAAGFAGETVWYDALSPEPFVAKCAAALGAEAAPRCLRTVYLKSGIAAVYAFDAPLLQSWRDFDARIALWLERAGAL